MLTLHSRENRFLFGYLLVATGLLTALAAWVLYRNYDFSALNAGDLSGKIKRQQQLFDEQKRNLPLLDSAHQAVVAYRPEVTAVFLEADIENQLSNIRRLYVRRLYTTNEADDTVRFFRAFDQAANFYQMIYRDKKILASKQYNAQLFAEQLADCKIGFRSKAPAGTVGPVAAPTQPLLTAPVAAPAPTAPFPPAPLPR